MIGGFRDLTALVGLLGAAACGGREGTAPKAPAFSVVGTWHAEYPTPGSGGNITLVLSQSEDRVSGSGTVRSAPDREPYPFTVSGRVADPEVTLHFATLAGCPASFYGRRPGAPPALATDTLTGSVPPSPCLSPVPALVFVRQE